MKIAGSYTLAVPQDRAYELLQDPVVLARAMPGCDRLDRIGEHEYAMKMKMAMASMTGLFDGKVRLTDLAPPDSFRMQVDGSGKVGFVKGHGVLKLSAVEAGTRVEYDGDVQVGGTIAAVGQRLIDTTSKMMIRKFFENLASAASAAVR